MRLLGYLRVSTAEQAESRAGLEAQERAIAGACEARDHELLELVRDEGESGKSLDRPGLATALERVAGGEADGLIVAKLDRLSRSVIDFGVLLEWFQEAEATLMALDLGVDTSTPGGRLVANVLVSVAEWERETIAARTRDGLASLRERGQPTGLPAVADRPELMERIGEMRGDGMTLQAIADRLNEERVPTARGAAKWGPSSVQTAAGYRRRRPRRKHPSLPEIPRRTAARSHG